VNSIIENCGTKRNIQNIILQMFSITVKGLQGNSGSEPYSQLISLKRKLIFKGCEYYRCNNLNPRLSEQQCFLSLSWSVQHNIISISYRFCKSYICPVTSSLVAIVFHRYDWKRLSGVLCSYR